MTYRPQWQGVIERYTWKFAHANHWRVRHMLNDVEDCVQEGAEQYCKLLKVYGDAIDSASHFMALYKRTLANRFIDLAKANQRYVENLTLAEDFLEQQYEEPLYLYADASPELRTVLEKIAVAPQELLDLLLPVPQTRYTPSIEQRISRSWCRLAQVGTVREDLVTELRGLLA